MKKVLVLVTTPPGARAGEALRCALGMTAADHEVSVAFAGDGVLAALRSVPPGDYLPRLRECARMVVELESLGAGIAREFIEPVMRPALLGLLQSADVVVGF